MNTTRIKPLWIFVANPDDVCVMLNDPSIEVLAVTETQLGFHLFFRDKEKA